MVRKQLSQLTSGTMASNLFAKVCLILVLQITTVFASDTPRLDAMNHILTASDPEQYPNQDIGKPTIVDLQIYILSLDSISETDMQFSLTVYWRMAWRDHRLKYEKIKNTDFIHIPVNVMKQVWVPDPVSQNEVHSYMHFVTTPNKKLRIWPSGRMFLDIKVSQTLTCLMSLRKFPFDSQVCSVSMAAYSHSTKSIRLRWSNDNPVLYNTNIKLPEFLMTSIQTYHSCARLSSGNHTQLVYQIYLTRQNGFYLTKVYLPTILVVILSWLSFWLDVESVPARISLGLLTVLTMTTMSAEARATLPRVSYIKAIDVWVGACLFFVFAALIEFAYVNVTARFENWFVISGPFAGWIPLDVCTNTRIRLSASRRHTYGLKSKHIGNHDKKTAMERAKSVDEMSRIGFPLVFILFNILYWTFYMASTSDKDDRLVTQIGHNAC